MRNAVGNLIGMMRDENQARGGLSHDTVHRAEQGQSLCRIQTLAGFIQDEQPGLLHCATGQERQALLTERKSTKGGMDESSQSKITEPTPGGATLAS
jgi:hypothetical protein